MRPKLAKWLILIALMAYTTAISLWAMNRAKTTTCRGLEIHISSQGLITDSTTQANIIAELAHFDPKLIGKPVGKISTSQIEQYFKQFSTLEDVQCAITSSGKLLLDITPIIPELRVFTGSESFYINKDGKRLNADARFHADVPVATGRFNKHIQPQDLLSLVKIIHENPTYRDMFTMINVDSENDIILVPRMQGHVVNIGDTSRLEAKLSKLMRAYHEILPYRGWQTYDTISVKFHGLIVATKRDKTQRAHVPEYEEDIDFEESSLDAAEGEQQKPQQENTNNPTNNPEN